MSIEGFNNEENYAPERPQPPTEPPAAESRTDLQRAVIEHDRDMARLDRNTLPPTGLRVHTATEFCPKCGVNHRPRSGCDGPLKPPTKPQAAECEDNVRLNFQKRLRDVMLSNPLVSEMELPTDPLVHTATPFKTLLVRFANAAASGDETRFAKSRDQILGRHDKLVAASHQVVDWYEGRVHNGPQERTQMYEAAKQALAEAEEEEI